MTIDETGFTMEDAEIWKLNFEGREGRYNAEGQRSFLCNVPEESVEELIDLGYNVKYSKPTDEHAARPFLNIAVGYKIRPPRVLVISGDNRMQLGEEAVGMLDWATIESVDLSVRKRHLPEGGVKGYLVSMYVTLFHDRLRAKYNDAGL